MSRGGKSKNAYLPGDLVALGSKTSRVEPNPQEKRGSNILLHRKLMESNLSGKFLWLSVFDADDNLSPDETWLSI